MLVMVTLFLKKKEFLLFPHSRYMRTQHKKKWKNKTMENEKKTTTIRKQNEVRDKSHWGIDDTGIRKKNTKIRPSEVNEMKAKGKTQEITI